MNSIHPTAIIGNNVRLGTDNVIGPFVIIAGNAVVGDRNWFGAGTVIGAPPEIRTATHAADWMSDPNSGGVKIGDDNVIRESVQVHSGFLTRTTIGNGLFIMNQSYIAHDSTLEDEVTMASSVTLGGHVHLGRGANIGLGTNIHQRRAIGAFAMIGMSSAVTSDIPPFVTAFGNPCRVHGVNAVGMSRSGYSLDDIEWVRTRLASDSPLGAARATTRLIAELEQYAVTHSPSISNS